MPTPRNGWRPSPSRGRPRWTATRHGVLSGRLVRRALWLLAEEGQSLEVEATFWVSPSWRFGHFLGYAGFLQSIRFALDPAANQFYFGTL